MTTKDPKRRGSQKKLLIAIGSTAISRGISAAGQSILSIYLARTIALDDFGRFSFCLTLLVALTMISRFGCDVSLLKFAGSAWHLNDRPRYWQVCRFSILFTSLLSLCITAVAALAAWLADHWHWEYASTMLLISLALLPSTLIYITSSCFKAAHRPQIGAMLEIGTVCLIAVLILACLRPLGWLMDDRSAAVVFVAASCLLAVIGLLSVWSLRKAKPLTESTDAKPTTAASRASLGGTSNAGSPTEFGAGHFLRTSRDFALIANAQVLGNFGGLLWLGIFSDETQVAFYSAALRIVLIPSLLVNIVVSICSPRLSGLHSAGDHAGLKNLAHSSATAIFAFNVPLLLAMVIARDSLMGLFGPAFRDHGNLLAIMALGLVLPTATILGSAILGMSGHHRVVRRVTLTSSALAIITSGVLVAFFGPTGAALGFAAYSMLNTLVLAIFVKRELGFWPTAGSTMLTLFKRWRHRPQTK